MANEKQTEFTRDQFMGPYSDLARLDGSIVDITDGNPDPKLVVSVSYDGQHEASSAVAQAVDGMLADTKPGDAKVFEYAERHLRATELVTPSVRLLVAQQTIGAGKPEITNVVVRPYNH